MTQKLEIGIPLKVDVLWYDVVPEPPKMVIHDGEITGWRATQVIVRIKDYAVLRFWKKSGIEVGNRDHPRRGFKIDLNQLNTSPKQQGVEVDLTAFEASDADS